jgi:undecaprenyl-diphosphatase
MAGLAVGLSDMISYRVIKFLIQRPRPFNNPEIAKWLRHVGDAHGPSFPSNHAANSFAAAVILSWYFPSLRKVFYIIAILIGYSRIALGVHYPSDVVTGAILGILVGLLIKVSLLNRWKFLRLKKSVSSSNTDSYSWRKRIRRLEQD